MDLITLAFYLFAAMTIGFGAIVVFSRNIMYSAFSLFFAFFGITGLYVLLNADFLAITQIMIYIGGILVLIIFGVILTMRVTGVDVKSGRLGKIQFGIGGAVAIAIMVLLIIVFLSTGWFYDEAVETTATAGLIGNELLTHYILAFEASSMLLLIAIVGAAFIARKKHKTE